MRLTKWKECAAPLPAPGIRWYLFIETAGSNSHLSPCRFFGSVLQRGAKLHRRKGGGSLTLLLVLPGLPARGEAAGDRARILILGPNSPAYRHLSAAQRAKLAAALAGDAASAAAPGGAASQEGCMRTEVRPAGALAESSSIYVSTEGLPVPACVLQMLQSRVDMGGRVAEAACVLCAWHPGDLEQKGAARGGRRRARRWWRR